jgi:hypothetical protein
MYVTLKNRTGNKKVHSPILQKLNENKQMQRENS